MSGNTDDSLVKFHGHNWEDLNRWVARTRFESLLDSDLRRTLDDGTEVPDDTAMSAYLAKNFAGAALDWAASVHADAPTTFGSFEGFVTAVRQGFGIAQDNVTALCRGKLDSLKMGQDIPVFFAELDRLFLALGISGHETRIAHVTGKLSPEIRRSMAEQGRMFHNYDTMREWLCNRWALMPKEYGVTTGKKPRCGSCGKKGHVAADCRQSKN
jgi:hypothetical protein